MDDKFVEILQKYVNQNDNITMEAMLVGDLGLSSFSMFAMVVELEEKYKVATDFNKLTKVKTVGDLYALYVPTEGV